MEKLLDFVKPELLVVAIVLYFVGMWLKQSESIKDRWIPLLLGGIGVLVCAIWVFATSSCRYPQEVAMAVFVALTQGIIVAGLSTYVNQLMKQSNKVEEDELNG